jgi:hypothetical protein
MVIASKTFPELKLTVDQALAAGDGESEMCR